MITDILFVDTTLGYFSLKLTNKKRIQKSPIL
ncbi:hypothetical protein Mucpa_4598 [Mucilaginibacter paludis DSM 18603]|uniref:Uncharacterized protein n=1 Tax=Mucilaginibacter paludis DSM 18603 TaxID=714943 RepID=H1Y768_9SPHI|nr:hypothetical protein Mucpa_4598 [Mucilaginibacter paludis DSM 18603]